MAGNVKEWVSNEVTKTSLRYILGGAWDEPAYRFAETDAHDPWRRTATFGVRLVKNLAPVEPDALAPVPKVAGDPKSVVPVSAQELEIYKRFYAYDRTPLNAQWTRWTTTRKTGGRKPSASMRHMEKNESLRICSSRDEDSPRTDHRSLSERIRDLQASSRDLDLRAFDFIVRSGRALLYPVYQGTFDRRSERSGTSTFRDVTVQQMKDFFRSVDYLATRQEIDMQRLGYSRSIGRLSLAPAAGARTAHQSGGRGVERAAVELATRDPADELRASRHHPVPHDQRP